MARDINHELEQAREHLRSLLEWFDGPPEQVDDYGVGFFIPWGSSHGGEQVAHDIKAARAFLNPTKKRAQRPEPKTPWIREALGLSPLPGDEK